MMTEKEAWLYLADCWDKAKPGAYSYVAFVKDEIKIGLCRSVSRLRATEDIDDSTYLSMDRKLYKEGGGENGNLYLYPLNVEGARARATLCRKFAGELE